MPPRIGMVTRTSAASTTSCGRPAPSPPSSTRRRRREVDVVHRGAAAWRRGRDAQAGRAPVLDERRRASRRAQHRQVERAAHRRAQRLPAPRIGRRFVEDDAGGAGGGGGANDRAGVARILQPRGGEHERRRRFEDRRRSLTDGRRALATTPVGEFTGESAFSTVPETSTICAPERLQPIDHASARVAVGGPQIAIFSTASFRGRRFAEQVPTVEQDHRSAAAGELAKLLDDGVLAAGNHGRRTAAGGEASMLLQCRSLSDEGKTSQAIRRRDWTASSAS